MDKVELSKRIGELEALINDTEETMLKARIASESMVEPIKSDFLIQLEFKQIQLNSNKLMLEQFKNIVKD